jgi:hypothetical protein
MGKKAEADELALQEAAYQETKLNGTAIRWRYWVEQMPTLNAAQAARLMSGLDPDIFADISKRPADADVAAVCDKARNIERLAVAQGRSSAPAAAWLSWARDNKFKVHVGFRIEVEAQTAGAEGLKPTERHSEPSSNPGQRSRRDLLTPLIEIAQQDCKDPYDTPTVWTKLLDMARERRAPLLGKTEEGLQWVDGEDVPRYLSRKSLGERLRRQKRAGAKPG